MSADMADDSADLLKTLEENRKALQKQIGCLAGILQIFDRQRCFTGRRYGSNRTSATNGKAFAIPIGRPDFATVETLLVLRTFTSILHNFFSV